MEILSILIALTGHFLAWSWTLGWFFSANWYDQLKEDHSEEDEMGLSGHDLMVMAMFFLIAASIGDIIALYFESDRFHSVYVAICSFYVGILALCVLIGIRQFIREKRGKK